MVEGRRAEDGGGHFSSISRISPVRREGGKPRGTEEEKGTQEKEKNKKKKCFLPLFLSLHFSFFVLGAVTAVVYFFARLATAQRMRCVLLLSYHQHRLSAPSWDYPRPSFIVHLSTG